MQRFLWGVLIRVNNWAWQWWSIQTEIVTRIGLAAYLVNRAIRALEEQRKQK